MNASVPFIYGRPVRGDEFLDRDAELRTIFNRLRNGESTAVVGEPHIGKSSVLIRIADDDCRRMHLGPAAAGVIVRALDLLSVSGAYTPRAFWEEALEPLRGIDDDDARRLAHAAQTQYDRLALERLFIHLGNRERCLVLLLDEFERLLSHPHFKDPAFFGLLRSLATRTNGLALVTASRMSVADMNQRGQALLETGSPFFNNMIEVRLRPFDGKTAGKMLDRAGDRFSSADRRFIRRVAGGHPFLLQAMAACLYEANGENRSIEAAERFYERVSFHFDDVWRALDDKTRTTAVILSLMELGGRAQERHFAYGEIERVDAFGPELRRLEELGLAEQVGEGWQFDREHLLVWRGAQWTIAAQSFTWWVRDVVIAETRTLPVYAEWLDRKQYRFLLTNEQWEKLLKTVRSMPPDFMRGIGALARSLLDELTARSKP